MPDAFQAHAETYLSHAEAMKSNPEEQFNLRDKIGFADTELAKLEHTVLIEVIAEWAKSKRTPNNVEERKAEVSKRLAANGIYLEAVRGKTEKQRELMIVTARYDFDRRMKRLAELEMLHINALLNAGANA